MWRTPLAITYVSEVWPLTTTFANLPDRKYLIYSKRNLNVDFIRWLIRWYNFSLRFKTSVEFCFCAFFKTVFLYAFKISVIRNLKVLIKRRIFLWDIKIFFLVSKMTEFRLILFQVDPTGGYGVVASFEIMDAAPKIGDVEHPIKEKDLKTAANKLHQLLRDKKLEVYLQNYESVRTLYKLQDFTV